MDAALLDRLASTLEIQRLQAEYCHGADKKDLARFLAVWHEDAVWDVGSAVFEGSDRIAWAVRRQWEGVRQMHHWTANASINVDGDVATAETDASSIAHVEGRWLLSAGTYTDRFERRDGVWRFARRAAAVHVTHALAPASPAPSTAVPSRPTSSPPPPVGEPDAS